VTEPGPGALVRHLTPGEIQQRVIRIPADSRLFPSPDTLFDLWHQGLPWAARIRSEHCSCGRPPGDHRHRYLEGAELHAGLRWEIGAELRFERDSRGRIKVDGDLVA